MLLHNELALSAAFVLTLASVSYTHLEGLYAVGNCSGGFYGGVDYPLTVGGLSIGRCYTEGYVTGKLVASL